MAGAASLSHAPYDHVPNWGGPYLSQKGADPSTAPQADYRSLSPGALELMGIRLIDGRGFTEDDDDGARLVVIVDDRLAARAWPGQSPIGQRLAVDPFVTGEPKIWGTVVGLVKHVRHRNPVEEVRDQVYFPQRQVLRNPSVYIVKTTGDPAAIVPSVRDALKRIDPALPIYDVRPLMAYVDGANATRAFTMQLAVIFALVALTLASVGIYGVIAYSVTLRHREFGVRRALGAGAAQVIALVARDGARLLTHGIRRRPRGSRPGHVVPARAALRRQPVGRHHLRGRNSRAAGGRLDCVPAAGPPRARDQSRRCLTRGVAAILRA